MQTNATVHLADFYVNHKRDLLIGNATGEVAVYLNTGLNIAPQFSGTSYDNILVTVPGGNAKPVLVDWDNDGKRDLLIGSSNGNVYLYVNQRLNASPNFSAAPSIVASVSANAAPVVVRDWDGDGLKDLLVGDGDGLLNLFLNEGTDDAPFVLDEYDDSNGERGRDRRRNKRRSGRARL